MVLITLDRRQRTHQAAAAETSGATSERQIHVLGGQTTTVGLVTVAHDTLQL